MKAKVIHSKRVGDASHVSGPAVGCNGRMIQDSSELPCATVLVHIREFAALEEEWEDLYQNSPLATPFQSWAWLYSWWESYGQDYELRLVTLRSGNLLVGIMPLMLERRGKFGRLLYVGTPLSEYNDVLVRREWEVQVSEAGRQALRQISGWHVADLQELRPEAATWSIFSGWTGPQTRVWQDNCPVINVKPWDELVASLSKNHRSTVRRALRRAEADGMRGEVAGQGRVEQAARTLVALHREAWRERDVNIVPEHLTQRFESCMVAAASRMTARGLGGISEFWRDGEVIISSFWVSGRDFMGTYVLGVSQEALRRYQWSSLYIWDAVNIACSRNSSRLDLLRGEESYKLRWSSRTVHNHRLILGQSPIFWSPYTGYHLLYAAARWYEQSPGSEASPQWIRSVATNGGAIYRALRNTYRAVRKAAKRHANPGVRS
jgi:CelD/BcsL family acetyltransferase involved in cellulose biosynthesis